MKKSFVNTGAMKYMPKGLLMKIVQNCNTGNWQLQYLLD